MRIESQYKFCTSNMSEVSSSLTSKQRLLQTNLHEFLCIDHSFSEAVFYSFSGNLVEVVRQPVPYHRKGSCIAGVLQRRDLGCKQTCSGDHKICIHACALCDIWGQMTVTAVSCYRVWRVWWPILFQIVYASFARQSIFSMPLKCTRAKLTPKKGEWRKEWIESTMPN